MLEVGSRLVLVAVLTAAGATLASGQTENVLYRFKGHSDNGYPTAGLVSDKAGNFYGTTSGFQIGCETVFELVKPTSPGSPWVEEVLHTFSCNNEATPYDAPIIDEAGNLYGTTFDNSVGSVFELTPPATQGGVWAETVPHSFTGQTGDGDGAGSVASLVMDKAGNLYGTTENGGNKSGPCASTGGCGVVFELTPPATQGGTWSEVILRAFNVTDGQVPAAGVTLDQAGNLYGTTFYGGPSEVGVIFKLAKPATEGEAWKETVLYNFTGTGDGGYPAGNLVLHGNNLYGTAVGDSEGSEECGSASDCGVIFELSPPPTQGAPWTENTLYAFTRGTDGIAPYAAVIFDHAGNLYTTTNNGGQSNNGTVVELSPPTAQGSAWTESILWRFGGRTDGANPEGSLILDPAGNLYSTTRTGGNGYGTVFRIKP
jgi:uncharacterized repeat protein (TIGR03803 family)